MNKSWIIVGLIMALFCVTPVHAVWHSTEASSVVDTDGGYLTDITNANDTDFDTYTYHTCGGTPCSAIDIMENYTWDENLDRADTNNVSLTISTNSTSGNTILYAWNYTDSSWDSIGAFGNTGSQIIQTFYGIDDSFLDSGNDIKFRVTVGSGTNSNTSYFESRLYWDGYPYFTNCSGGGTKYLTFYGIDENSQNAVDFEFETYFEMANSNASFDMTGQNNYSICIDPGNESYVVNGTIRYSATGYSERYYYLDNANLTAVNQNITLYLLNSSDSTLITMAVLDETNSPEDDVVVVAQKKDIGLGTYISVVEAKSDFEGYAYANMEIGENYKFYLYREGIVLREYEEMQLQTDALTFYVSSINIPEYFSYYNQVASSCSYDNSSLNLTCNYVDTSGLSMTMIFEVWKMGQAGKIDQCSDNSTASSGTFVCTLTDNATYQYDMSGCYPNDCGYTWQSGWIGLGEFGVNYGATGLFLAILIICICSLTAYYDVRLALVSTAFGFIFCGLINLIQFGTGGIFVMFSVALIIGTVAIKVRT